MDNINYNKSTDNLLASDGSIEQIFVPPLELKSKNKNHSDSDDRTSCSSRHTNASRTVKNHETVLVMDPSDIHVEGTASKIKVPIPAARKSILPPIAADRRKSNSNSDGSGKDFKNNRNQLTQQTQNSKKHSDQVIEMISERRTAQKHVSIDNIESDTEIREVRQKQKNNIELTSLTKEARKKINRRFVPEELNEETTSFVSYQEKHENENNIEELSSKHSEQDEVVENEEVLNDETNLKKENDKSDKQILKQEDVQPIAKNVKKKTKSKGKTKRKPEKLKNKRSRNQRSVEKPEEEIKPLDDTEKIEKYDFKNVIGVWLYETSALRFDSLIRQPRVRVSIYNINEQSLLMKSNPLRNAVLNYEPTNVNFIQPILSDKCRFKESSDIECDWNGELLIINEDIRHIQKGNVIFLFEIVDILSNARNIEQYGWYQICWAFLKPGDSETFSNINIRCSLQLHYYQRNRTKNTVFDEWKSQKRIKYPAYLAVKIGSYKPELTRSISLRRPMSVLEEEITGDIYINASDIEDANENNEENYNGNHGESQLDLISADRKERKMQNVEIRLPGQPCKCPNHVIYKYKLSNTTRNIHNDKSQYGSMTLKFSPSGTLLAFHCTTYGRSNHEVLVMDVDQLKISHKLVGHLNIIYDMDWLNGETLATVSSDRTAIVWLLSKTNDDFTLKILPHSSFVYAVKWLNQSSEYAYIATGSRDGIIRVWKIYGDFEADIELCDELKQHENYITSVAANQKASKIYSADWNGVLLEWSHTKSHKEKANGSLYRLQRKIKLFPTSVLKIELHPKSNRLYVQCANDPLIYVIETTSAIVMQTLNTSIGSGLEFSQQKRSTFNISPCGSKIFTSNSIENRIECINLTNISERNFFHIPVSLATRKMSITSFSYHPQKHLLATGIFGDILNASLYLIAYENETASKTNQMKASDFSFGKDVDLERDLHKLEEWHNIRTINNNVDNKFKPNTFDSILNRIDDLFFMAIQTPKHTDDYEQLKDMQSALEKLQRLSQVQIPTSPNERDAVQTEYIENVNEKHKIDLRSHSESSESINIVGTVEHVEKNDQIVFFDKKQKRNERKKSNDSKSSHGTFVLNETQNKKANKQLSDEDAKDGTYSIQSNGSERSNLTFEIKKSDNIPQNTI